MKKISIDHFNNRHNELLRALNFYKQEVGILRDRLTEIAGRNTANEVLKQVEHFENQFRIQSNNINKLKNDIRVRVVNNGVIDERLMANHDMLEQSFASEERVVNELRNEFNSFSAEYM